LKSSRGEVVHRLLGVFAGALLITRGGLGAAHRLRGTGPNWLPCDSEQWAVNPCEKCRSRPRRSPRFFDTGLRAPAGVANGRISALQHRTANRDTWYSSAHISDDEEATATASWPTSNGPARLVAKPRQPPLQFTEPGMRREKFWNKETCVCLGTGLRFHRTARIHQAIYFDPIRELRGLHQFLFLPGSATSDQPRC